MLVNIKAELARNKSTQEKLAKELGISRRTLFNWINETTEIPSSALIKMAVMWECTTDYLLGINKEISNQQGA